MHNTIPSDVITLVYKELHKHLISQLIDEYRDRYYFPSNNVHNYAVSLKKNGFMFNYRYLCSSIPSYVHYTNYCINNYTIDYIPNVIELPKRYKFSSIPEIDYV